MKLVEVTFEAIHPIVRPGIYDPAGTLSLINIDSMLNKYSLLIGPFEIWDL